MEDVIDAVRSFNRFFTRFVGALDSDFLKTGMSLGEARILLEIAHREPCFADDLQRILDLDGGFVSRIVQRFEERKWIGRTRCDTDGRRRDIALTPKGRKQFEFVDERQRSVIERNLSRLRLGDRRQLVRSLGTVQTILEKTDAPVVELRPFRAGDMGLIVSRQSILYQTKFGWSQAIEVIEGEVTTAFLRNFKPGREQCWIAEIDGQMAGSVFITDEGNDVARLRLLYVEPEFHGLGIGNLLVSTCVAFAREVGYARITLWTQSILEAARAIYAKQGFQLVSSAEHETFGVPLMGETWELSPIAGPT
jgi:DNA-binding MarR family transcriptional regulator/GNAT superfamily N-acetyltransferase